MPAAVTMTAAGGPIAFLSLNARSLFNKIDELQLLILKHKPAFVCVQETWCSSAEPDSLYQLPQYLMERRDRAARAGGGVCIYIREGMFSSCERLVDFETDDYEAIWLKLTPKTGLPLLLCSVYRPPGALSPAFATALERALNRATAISQQLLITGDFNARNTAWYQADSTDSVGDSLHQLFSAAGLRQLNSFPTNLYAGQLRSCLDLVATNISSTTTCSLPPLGSSDHVVVLGSIYETSAPQPALRDVWCWSKADVKGLQTALKGADWSPVLQSTDIDEAWTTWKRQLLHHARLFIPRRTVPESPSPRPWLTGLVVREIKEKHRLFRVYKRTRSEEAWTVFKQQRNKVNSAVRRAKMDFVEGLTTQATRGPPNAPATAGETGSPRNGARTFPRLHQFLRCFLPQTNSHIPDLLDDDGRLVSSATDKAELLNNFFVRQALPSAPDTVPPDLSSLSTAPMDTLTDFHISRPQVLTALQTLDVTKAPGGDGLPTRLLRLAADEIADCVHHLFNLSLTTGRLPGDWRQATITPIYKNRGSRSSASNYRPISLLSVLSKVLERLIFDSLYSYLEPLLPASQFGFRPRHSTTLQLVRLVHDIAASLNDHKYVFTCFFDLAKAFDRVWHRGLLSKLDHFGVRGNALRWLTAYLTNRTQRVRLGQAFSSWRAVPAGVPQGSVLGPLLFIAYTSDLPSTVTDPSTNCDLYADDTSLSSSCTTAAATALALQMSVNNVGSWLADWRLAANLSKTTVMEFTRRALPSRFTTSLDGSPLTRATSQRHLGITFTGDLRWTAHVNSILAKAAPLLYTLTRLRSQLPKKALSLFYKLYILPRIEYADVCWSPLPSHLRDRLERFQRRAAKVILRRPLFAESDHDELLRTMQWSSLESRRNFHHALLAHAIAAGQVPRHLSDAAYPCRDVPYSLRRTEHFHTPIPNALFFSRSPLFHSSTLYNSLPPDVQAEANSNKFKERAAAALLSSTCPCAKHIRC